MKLADSSLLFCKYVNNENILTSRSHLQTSICKEEKQSVSTSPPGSWQVLRVVRGLTLFALFLKFTLIYFNLRTKLIYKWKHLKNVFKQNEKMYTSAAPDIYNVWLHPRISPGEWPDCLQIHRVQLEVLDYWQWQLPPCTLRWDTVASWAAGLLRLLYGHYCVFTDTG